MLNQSPLHLRERTATQANNNCSPSILEPAALAPETGLQHRLRRNDNTCCCYDKGTQHRK